MIEATTIEARVEVRPLTRQIRRNIERKAAKARGSVDATGTHYVGGVRCRYCPVPVVDATTAVLANGQVAHQACVENIDTIVDQMNHDAAAHRLEEAGVVFAKPNLIAL